MKIEIEKRQISYVKLSEIILQEEERVRQDINQTKFEELKASILSSILVCISAFC